jgi:hypothetical protein
MLLYKNNNIMFSNGMKNAASRLIGNDVVNGLIGNDVVNGLIGNNVVNGLNDKSPPATTTNTTTSTTTTTSPPTTTTTTPTTTTSPPTTTTTTTTTTKKGDNCDKAVTNDNGNIKIDLSKLDFDGSNLPPNIKAINTDCATVIVICKDEKGPQYEIKIVPIYCSIISVNEKLFTLKNEGTGKYIYTLDPNHKITENDKLPENLDGENVLDPENNRMLKYPNFKIVSEGDNIKYVYDPHNYSGEDSKKEGGTRKTKNGGTRKKKISKKK